MNIQPLRNNILIDIHKVENAAGIIYANKDEEKVEKATVIAIGNHVSSVEVGDVIFFKNYATDSIGEYHIIEEDEVKAIEHETHTQH